MRPTSVTMKTEDVSPPMAKRKRKFNHKDQPRVNIDGGDATGDGLQPSEVIEDLRSRFANTRVEVTIPLSFPKHVYVINAVQEAVDETSEEEVLYNVEHSDIPLRHVTEYEQKWSSQSNNKDAAALRRLNIFLKVLKDQSKRWTYNPTKKSWSTVTTASATATEEHDQGVSFEGRDENLTSLESLLKHKFERSLGYALSAKMVHSMGRNFVSDMLAAVLYVCFGEKYFHFVDGLGVGFPVSSKETISDPLVQLEKTSPEAQVKQWVTASASIKKSPRTSRKKAHFVGPSPDSSVVTSSSSSSAVSSFGSDISRKTESSSGTSASGKRYIYPDYVLISVKDRPPVYVLVVEIKSSSLTHKCMAQLYRDMIGAGMHQSEVFGFILNTQEARIVRMTVDHKAKMIRFSSSWVCEFVHSLSDLCELFRSLVAVIEYGFSFINVNKNVAI